MKQFFSLIQFCGALIFLSTLLAANANAQPVVDPTVIDVRSALATLNKSFVTVQPGSFWMGAPDSVRSVVWTPTSFWQIQHRVNIRRKYEIQLTLMNQETMVKLMGFNPSLDSQALDCVADHQVSGKISYCPNLPVGGIHLNRARDIVKRLNSVQNNYNYSLPSDAQWEFAVKGPTTSRTDTVCLNPLGMKELTARRQIVRDALIPNLTSQETIALFPDPSVTQRDFALRGYNLDTFPMQECVHRSSIGSNGGHGRKSNARSSTNSSSSDIGIRLVRTIR